MPDCKAKQQDPAPHFPAGAWISNWALCPRKTTRISTKSGSSPFGNDWRGKGDNEKGQCHFKKQHVEVFPGPAALWQAILYIALVPQGLKDEKKPEQITEKDYKQIRGTGEPVWSAEPMTTSMLLLPGPFTTGGMEQGGGRSPSSLLALEAKVKGPEQASWAFLHPFYSITDRIHRRNSLPHSCCAGSPQTLPDMVHLLHSGQVFLCLLLSMTSHNAGNLVVLLIPGNGGLTDSSSHGWLSKGDGQGRG